MGGGLAREWQLKSWGGPDNLENEGKRRKKGARGVPGNNSKEEGRKVS